MNEMASAARRTLDIGIAAACIVALTVITGASDNGMIPNCIKCKRPATLSNDKKWWKCRVYDHKFFIPVKPIVANKKRTLDPDSSHIPSISVVLALKSITPLVSWNVYVVEFEPLEKPRQLGPNNHNDDLRKMVSRLNIKLCRTGLVCTCLFEDMQIVFAKIPTNSTLQLALDGWIDNEKFKVIFHEGNNYRIRCLDPNKSDDWDVYKDLLSVNLEQQLPKHVKGASKVLKVAGCVVIEKEMPQPRKVVCQKGTCSMIDSDIIAITKIEVNQTSYLLVHCEVKYTLEAIETIHEIFLKTNQIPSIEAKTIGWPITTGMLCAPETNGSIGDYRRINGVNDTLIDYNCRDSHVRKNLLKNADKTTPAVGLELKNGKKYDYPPHILRPLFKITDLPAKIISSFKRKEKVWFDRALNILRSVAPCEWPTPINFDSVVKLFEPNCFYFPTPTFENGPMPQKVQIKLIFPDSVPEEMKTKIFSEIKAHRRFCNTWKFLDTTYYNPESPESVQAQLHEALKTTKLYSQPADNIIILAILPTNMLKEKQNEYRKAIKNAAQQHNLGSQCATLDLFETDLTFTLTGLLEGLTVKAGV